MDFSVFDAHCDTLTKVRDFDRDLRHNEFHLDIERLQRYSGGYTQVFAAFVDRKNITVSPMQRALSLIDCYFEQLAACRDAAAHCSGAEEIKRAHKNGKIATLLAVEGGEAIEGSLENLRTLYRLGVRIMTLTWNYANGICDGIGEMRGAGLTGFGRDVVKEMNRLHMLIDVSHISRRGFWDVMECSAHPVAATHSNCYAVHPHPRNLDDEQIRAVFESGGCVGINLYPDFVSEGRCTVDEIMKHTEHLLSLGGENNIGFGSDFDGIDKMPDGVCGVQDMDKIINRMLSLGYTEDLVRKIASENFLRLTEYMDITEEPGCIHA